MLRFLFSCVADHTPARPSTSSNSRDTAVDGWSSPTSTLSKNYYITTVSAPSDQPSTRLASISSPVSDGAGEGKGKLLDVSLSWTPVEVPPSYPINHVDAQPSPRSPAFDPCRTRFPYPPHRGVSAYQISLKTVWTSPVFTIS